MSLYYSKTHHHPKRHAMPHIGAAVRRERHKLSLAAAAPSTAKEAPTYEVMETKAPPPAAEFSTWEPIKYPHWDGYWRAQANTDGGWTYQFTQDLTTILEPNFAEIYPSTQPPSSLRASTVSEQMLFGETVTLATTARTSFQPKYFESPSAISMTKGGCNCTLCIDAASLAPFCDGLDVARTGNRHSTKESSVVEQGAVNSGQEAAPSTTTMAARDGLYGEIHGHDKRKLSVAARTTKKGSHSQHHYIHTVHHRHSHHFKNNPRHPKEIGEVVRADKKKKKHNPQAIVDNWDWEWPGGNYGA